MKKVMMVFTALALVAFTMVGCGAPAAKSDITVISREEGSGTRGAFVELFGIEQKDESGKKVDLTIETADINDSTGVVLTNVAQNKNAIGYVSLGAVNDTVKALKIDGVVASVATIKDSTYKMARPFNVVVKEGSSEIAQDFMSFILATQGQAVVEGKGYISVGEPVDYNGIKATGKLVVAGSSSVAPVMELLKEAYEAVNPNATIEIQQSDSTTGINSVTEGVCDIGMASRELKDSEIEKGLIGTPIAIDGIAVVVNGDNTIEGLTKEQVMEIYTGKLTSWTSIK